MPRLPVKKIRKQLKLLLLLALLTSAAWFTYLHISLMRQGRALRLPFTYGRDGERLGEVTDPGRRPAVAQAVARQRKAEDSSESHEEEQNDGQDLDGRFSRGSRATRRPKLNLTKQVLPWDEKYKGKANLHVFEDWCGGAVRHLRKNLHFPLFPHTRTTVKKLAVSPKWKNYGLRIFGYIHPFKDGDFQFAVASDDNSEFWLSSDESPSNSRLAAFVGKLGTEWTAPGEFTKFSSQVSKPLRLMSSRRYYFELLHKQDDRGSDHVEVGWRVFLPSLKFEVIDSSYISLYTDESTLKMNHVEHIPQSLASHSGSYLWEAQWDEHGADMLKSDPRDTFFLTPAIEPSRVENVLVPCAYSPTYVVKDFPIARYQGLQFVYLSFVYPNDFTRLTHMETENKCFYRESPLYLEKFGFYKYMKMDEEEEDPRQRAFLFLNPDNFLEDDEEDEDTVDSPEATDPPPKARKNLELVPETQRKEILPVTRDYGDYLDYYSFRRKQSRVRDEVGMGRWSMPPATPSPTATPVGPHGNGDTGPGQERVRGRMLRWLPQEPSEEDELGLLVSSKRAGVLSLQSHLSVPIFGGKAKTPAPSKSVVSKEERKPKKAQEKVYVTRLQPGKRKAPAQEPAFPNIFLYPKLLKKVQLRSRTPQKHSITPSKLRTAPGHRTPWLLSNISKERESARRKTSQAGDRRWRLVSKQEELGAEGIFSKETHEDVTTAPGRMAVTTDYNSSEVTRSQGTRVTSFLKTSEITTSQQEGKGQEEEEEEEVSDYSYETGELPQSWLEDSINWQRTFSVSSVDFELLRSDWNDLRCNVSGNLQLSESEVVDVVAQYMEKLNEKNGGIYTLLRIINVEKRRDTARGNRYLLELELAERGQRTVRLSEYVYVLLHQGKQDDSAEANPEGPAVGATETQPSTWSILYGKPTLCRPLQLSWKQDIMVHFVVPVKNQARWVQQFISDMVSLYDITKDANFNVILVDFDSDDMDVEKALQDAQLPRYQYLRRTGNFERSAGLQAGVDMVEDGHSIVFLCDLHIHFPSNILDSIRKHCVEGKLAYAPIVMRLSCGSSPREPNGYWEVNGFGLFGIYKSDFDRVGGMNTEEFRDRWGGEDWELLDRVLQSGLEVERLRLRNFYHYYHSKRGMWNAHSKKSPKD
ncbi:N-acetyl-beta-glucosaminyl-glycoprotein 4-beta-N-acetylgalactosaminyltransferase 1 isoform X1 [Centrocercus urophasianus]|uniref:N-acetyl-beta-glucosaminyl-glycoprotein 4-beta-N-acetylgalactosaminyltransferase 1 isoform X1 n=1 Tax=Centrocercus urophasianus TaxID=9002 RepID=UPI001C64A2F6|nr:N-acetyl-beta-glucosaminyl-glycoprotein 4-beta-N-acetylgalactosaminyltransferase 1 isoform X1 [Centrocercus urophasianus]